jgi:hypothetical protein
MPLIYSLFGNQGLKKCQKTQLFPLLGELNFVNSKNSSNFAVAFAEKSAKWPIRLSARTQDFHS